MDWYKNFKVKHFRKGHVLWLSGNDSAGWLVKVDHIVGPRGKETHLKLPNTVKPKHIEWIELTFSGEYVIDPPKYWPAESWHKGNIDGMVFAFPIIIALDIDVTSFLLRYGDKILKL